MLRWLKRIVVAFFAIVGLIAVAFAVLGAWAGSSLLKHPVADVPGTAVLALDLTKPLAASERDDSIAALLGEEDRLSLRQVETALDRARGDARVKGLILRLGDQNFGIGITQELRDAIAAFRKSGKFALAFAESYGGGGGGSDTYYLAVSCDEVWLQPSGELDLAGVIAETPFLKGTLDKLGVAPRFSKREEYKTAIDELTDASYSPAFKESMTGILGSIYDQLVEGIADGRGMAADAVKSLIDRGPYLALDALNGKLVDRLGYRDQADAAALARAGKDAAPLALADYFRATDVKPSGGRVIALIDAKGTIVSGESDLDRPFAVGQMGADTVAKAIDDAGSADDVAAIVLRIDSPGGSYVASDTIWRAVAHAKAAGKPVIVSMGDVAASGGYFIAAPATKIVAEPGTLTGSIGVFGGKFVLAGLLDKLGVTFDSVQFGANAGIWSSERDFTPAGRAKLEASLDAVYRDFTGKVAAGRGIDPGRIPDIAKGRVFTGAQALKLGLVDALGGLPTALDRAREAAGIKPDEGSRIRTYPKPERPFRHLLTTLISGEARADATPLAGLLARIGADAPYLRPLLAQLPALGRESWLLMPPVEIR